MSGIFVTGTDTAAGKTILSAALLAAMCAAGEKVRAHKPVLTGADTPPSGPWPADDELLALACGMDAQDVTPVRYGPAVSPHLAAALAGEKLDRASIVDNARAAERKCRILILEGVGGLLVPLLENFTICDLAVELGYPVLIAARPGLGTINHTLLTLHAAREAQLDVRAVVLTPWPDRPSPLECSNLRTIGRLGTIEVARLPYLQGPNPAGLAQAGAKLPFRRWL
ncbi:MAG TPA: dethiobiotin synthase [Solirubrobacteraceae bacterium]|jgi:dethiobiotin synthetase|nr:dethiobiotin synthase [Solirubrobacteraceae bacterium]